LVKTLKLPLAFDAGRLRADLDNISPAEWVAHFNDRYYEGDWSAVALRSVGGAVNQIYPDPTAQSAFADTPILARCPNIQEALGRFECPLQSARLLRLTPGSRIREHRDYKLGYEDGEIRIHVPVTSNPEVEFYLDGERVVMNEGECWYINFNLPHQVENRGGTDRIHLVVDCVVNDWVREKFPKG